MHKLPDYLLLGSGANFTYQVLKQLLSAHCLPSAYVQYGSKISHRTGHFENIPVESRRPLSPFNALIHHHDIPFYYQSSLHMDEWIKQMNIDFLLVACWPDLIPAEIINSVNQAALNLHPSLLPAFRGFDPLTDQLNAGNSSFGVSLHLLNQAFDSGDIVLQSVVTPQPAANRLEIEAICAEKGVQLFIQALQTYSHPGWNLIKQAGH